MEYGLHDIIEMKKPHPCEKCAAEIHGTSDKELINILNNLKEQKKLLNIKKVNNLTPSKNNDLM